VTLATLAGSRYRVERLLGHGGMASVYLAHDAELDRPVAVKVLTDALAGEDELRQRFLREGRTAAALSHPNVVSVFDAGEEDGRPYIVMEYVAGETLADTLAQRGPLPPEEAVDLALQACAGLAQAHASGLVHRDVKPQNLLIGEGATVKVADFGIARAAEATQLTATGTILGTAAYLAPEQAAGEPVTPATDVYALGAVLYELLTGRVPHDTRSLGDLARRQAGEPATPPSDLTPGIPPAVEDVVMRALARLPEHRPPTAGDLAADLTAALSDTPTVPLQPDDRTVLAPLERGAAPRGDAGPAGLRAERRGGRAALAAAVVATLVLGVLALATIRGVGDGADPAPAQVQPVPPAQSPEERARALAEWLRANAR
jgi:eukaryotic-like serine/threonine-protein kinase